MSNVRPEELQKAVNDILENFRDATAETCKEAVKLSKKEALRELHNANPSGSGKYGSWADYNKSWTSRDSNKDKYYHYVSTIYNKDHYRLTHLLEKGHALPQGGRAQAYPHIAPVAERAEENLFKHIKDGI